MRFVAIMRWASAAVLAAAAALLIFVLARPRPQDLPWTRLDLSRPVGAATGAKLAALDAAPALCRRLLAVAGLRDRPAPPVSGPNGCGYADGMRLAAGGAGTIAWRPAPVTRCAMAASLAVWEWEIVQPAAIRRYGMPVVAIEDYGSYACRRIAGRGTMGWSQHATANAIDVAGFRLADGRRVTIAAGWHDGGRDGAFLHDVRDGACRLFATTLSPDYNAAHRDHLHLDQAPRGAMGWRACR